MFSLPRFVPRDKELVCGEQAVPFVEINQVLYVVLFV